MTSPSVHDYFWSQDNIKRSINEVGKLTNVFFALIYLLHATHHTYTYTVYSLVYSIPMDFLTISSVFSVMTTNIRSCRKNVLF